MVEIRLSKISVVVPVHNVEDFIRACFESVLAQDYQDFEVLCVDDGSTDQSGDICDEFATRDDRFVVVHTANQGIGNARNRGLELATGTYCFFLDPDDLMPPGTLAYLLDLIEATSSDVVLGASRNFQGAPPCFDENTDIVNIFSTPERILREVVLDKRDLRPFAERSLPQQLDYEFFSCLYRMSTIRLEQLRFLNLSYGEDTYFCLAYLLASHSVATTTRTTYLHRKNPTSVTYRYHPDYLSQTKEYVREYMGLFQEQDAWVVDTVRSGLDAQYFYRCSSAIDRELAYGPATRSYREMTETIREVFQDGDFRRLLRAGGARHIASRQQRWVLRAGRWGLVGALVTAFRMRHRWAG